MLKDPLQPAKDKGNLIKEYYCKNSLSLNATCLLLNLSISDVSNLTTDNKLIHLPILFKSVQTICFVYPQLQFIDNTYIKGLDVLIPMFASIWDVIMFLDSGDYYLSGKKPIDILKEGDLNSVLIAAENYGEQRAL